MKPNEKAYHEIKACLTGKFDINTAMRLHTKYSKNFKNKKILALYPVKRRTLLKPFLRELFNAFKPAEVKEEIPEQPEPPTEPLRVTAPKSISEKLKKDFPKLEFEELPDNFKLLVIKRYSAWEESKRHHKAQHEATTDAERFEHAKDTFLNAKENWDIWEELEHYHMYGKPIGKHSSFKISEFQKEIEEVEKLPVAKMVKELTRIRKNKRTAINRILNIQNKKKKITEQQQEVLDISINEFNIVSVKLDEPEWKL